MLNNFKKWILSNIDKAVFTKSCDGHLMLFVDYEDYSKVLKHLNKTGIKYSYSHRCNYECTAFIFQEK